MKFTLYSSAILVCFAVASCTLEQGVRLESTLTYAEARTMLGDEPVNPARQAYAIRQLDRLAGQGDSRALGLLSIGYLRGENGLSEDAVLAARYFELRREAGDAFATRTLIRLYEDPQSAAYNPEQLIALLSEDFEGGDEASGLRLVDVLSERGDIAQAQALQSVLISGGNERAQRNLAASLLDETNPEYNPSRAIDLYEELAAQENAEALRQLGLIYLRGTGVEVDRTRAFGYLERSFVAGNDRAGTTIAALKLNSRTDFYDERGGYMLFEELAGRGEVGAWIQLARRAPERYVRVMQDVLRAQGVYQAASTGQIDPLTIQALVEWCPANDVPGDCTLEPYGNDLARALARAARRAQS